MNFARPSKAAKRWWPLRPRSRLSFGHSFAWGRKANPCAYTLCTLLQLQNKVHDLMLNIWILSGSFYYFCIPDLWPSNHLHHIFVYVLFLSLCLFITSFWCCKGFRIYRTALCSFNLSPLVSLGGESSPQRELIVVKTKDGVLKFLKGQQWGGTSFLPHETEKAFVTLVLVLGCGRWFWNHTDINFLA